MASASRSIVDSTSLFQETWYRRKYDVAPTTPALEHYLKVGYKTGNDPSPIFDSKWYRNRAGYIARDVSPLEHYVSFGWRHGVDPHPLFSSAWYLEQLGDESLENLTPLEHYLTIGWTQGLTPCSLFNGRDYYARNPDVAAAGVEPLAHFLIYGQHEGRLGSAFLNVEWYRKHHRDDESAAVLGEIAHYLHVNSSIGLPCNDDPLANRIVESLVNSQRRVESSLMIDADGQVPLRIDWDGRVSRLEVPRSDLPRVSVIIPTLNHSEDVIRCLESIVDSGETTPFEVIVVDDGSSDAEIERFRQIGGIKLVSHAENKGFAAACGTGVAASSAEFIYLLNNDTRVVAGWLDGLIEEVDRDPRIAIVGSMVIASDFRLQEAGAFIFSDGSGMQYGRGESPLDWRYRSKREVDYCSGSSLLIRRSLWDEVGGFDERFAPAYYEDTDLCFAARQAGYSVFYTPFSVIFHFEGLSAGNDGTGSKRFQFRNRERFVEKWNLVLNSQPVRPDDVFEHRPSDLFRVAERRADRHILVIDHCVPTADRDSGSLRMTRILESFTEQGRVVHFVPLNGLRMQPYSDDLAAKGIEVVGARPDDEEVQALIAGLSGRLEMVMVARPQVAAMSMSTVLTLTSGVPLVYDMVDAHGVRVRKAGHLHGKPELVAQALQLEHLEARVARLADVVITVSQDDQSYIERIARIPLRTIRIPNIHPRADIAGGFETRRDLLFVGGYGHLPNVDAALYLVHEILPLLLAELPDIRIVLVGSNPPAEVTALRGRNVIVPGWVADLGPVYAEARVVVAPLRYGAGVKGKIGEALSHGVPIVTTATGAEGLSLTHDKDVLIGDSPESLAAAIIRAYRDQELWESLRVNGLAIVEELFGESISKKRVIELLDAISETAVP